MRSRSTFDLVATGLLLGSAALFTSAFSSRLQAQPANPAQARPVQARTYPGTPPNVQLDPPAAVSTSSSEGHWDCAARKAGEPVAQIAILLDTSSSMDGLIHQARTQVWRIVNELGRASYKGQRPQVQVALYEYGKSTLAREQGYVRCIAPFTTDLDRLSENLFALRTCGGEEYCGWVIRDA